MPVYQHDINQVSKILIKPNNNSGLIIIYFIRLTVYLRYGNEKTGKGQPERKYRG